jgi:hypothetical protein
MLDRKREPDGPSEISVGSPGTPIIASGHTLYHLDVVGTLVSIISVVFPQKH